MTEIVNLRQARKRAARKAAEAEAAVNRAKHGQSKDERRKITADRDRVRRDLDGAKKD